MKIFKTSNGFVFQAIPLDEAKRIANAGSGIYSEIKEVVLRHFEEQNGNGTGEAFAFGLPNGKEVPEKDRKNICMSVTHSLHKAGLSWKVIYSGSRKLFVCVPGKENRQQKPQRQHSPRPLQNGDSSKEMEALIEKAMEVFQIPRETLMHKRKGFINKELLAVINVARDVLKMPAGPIAQSLGFAHMSGAFRGFKNSHKAKPEIAKLKAALK